MRIGPEQRSEELVRLLGISLFTMQTFSYAINSLDSHESRITRLKCTKTSTFVKSVFQVF